MRLRRFALDGEMHMADMRICRCQVAGVDAWECQLVKDSVRGLRDGGEYQTRNVCTLY